MNEKTVKAIESFINETTKTIVVMSEEIKRLREDVNRLIENNK